MQRIIIIISILMIATLVTFAFLHSDYRKKSFQETLTVHQKDVVKVTMEFGGVTKQTTDKSKIDILFKYFDRVKYVRMRGDQTAFMPTKAHIIYLHSDDFVDFIVPYNDEAMISYKVYKVKDGQITNRFMTDYYQSLN